MSNPPRYAAILLGTALALFLKACTLIPPNPDRPVTQVITPPTSSPLTQTAKTIQANGSRHQSHFLLVNSASEAMKWRLAMIDSATGSIDIQTFLWANDHCGALIFNRLIQAAKRGVRIRLLVDDIWLTANDQNLSSLCQHPHINIRLYNPSRVRNSKFGQAAYFLNNYRTMNRRMHNKTFIADGVMAIHGGRNVGNQYFGLAKTYNFRDLDVISTGPVLKQIKHEFDQFWNSPQAYPAEELAHSPGLETITEEIRELNQRVNKQGHDILSSYPTSRKDWSDRLTTLPSRMTPGSARFVSDIPDTDDNKTRIMVDELGKMLNKAKKEIIVVSPYFIPYKQSLDGLREATAKGVKVKILVPSMGANNHTPAHSHYRKYRKRILEAGAELYEYNFQPSEPQRSLCDVSPARAEWIGLHMKTMIADRQHCYIGTLNLDPRAMNINTEEGLIINSPALGKELASLIDEALLPENSWQLRLNDKGKIRWHGKEAEPLRRQPARSGMQRFIDAIARWVPIEKEL
ncbi:phospholipase D family protein [Verrucomicrobiaceae bacterium N1E253]|uniref:Phospholipase D family protein n=1 Tax=Oceaniferula marina TaxID=2748318 RepID=A0A851GJA9_9BACT|nr:phospholipase D family protein [Oceaniferula marina]NWK57416.1 phospholipase D family protein [Oceaniferula marina]